MISGVIGKTIVPLERKCFGKKWTKLVDLQQTNVEQNTELEQNQKNIENFCVRIIQKFIESWQSFIDRGIVDFFVGKNVLATALHCSSIYWFSRNVRIRIKSKHSKQASAVILIPQLTVDFSNTWVTLEMDVLSSETPLEKNWNANLCNLLSLLLSLLHWYNSLSEKNIFHNNSLYITSYGMTISDF